MPMNSDKQTSPWIASSSMAWFCRSWKVMLGALICTLVVNILCLPLWTDYDVIEFFRTPFNKDAHMEIIYNGPLTGAEAFSITASKPSLGTFTNYCYVAKDTQRYTANLRIEKEWTPYNLTLKVHRKGYIQFRLKGPYERNDYGRVYSIAADYKNLRIGGKEIFSERKKVTCVNDFSYRIPVNVDDIMEISFDVRRHHINADDFSLIKTKNFWYIITLSIAAFVVSCVLLRYLGAACRIGKAEDAIFLFAFFLFLLFPLSTMSDAQKSVRENRTLATRPKLSEVLRDDARIGQRYDGWFCDHLGGRAELIKVHDFVEVEMRHIVKGRRLWKMMDDGWIWTYGAPFTPFASLDNLKRAMHPIATNFGRLEKFCEANHIKLYVLVVPHKESVYQEYMYGYGTDKERGAAEVACHEQMKHLIEEQHVTYIYPWKELREASKQDYTYFKALHHWTDWGAYIGYRTLMREVRKDFPDIPVASLKDYKQTQSNLLRDDWKRDFYVHPLVREVKRFFHPDADVGGFTPMYNYYDHKSRDRLAMQMSENTKDFSYKGGAYKVMLLGDSQCDNFVGFLSYSGRKTKYIRLNRHPRLRGAERYKILKYYGKEILSYKPEILILLVWMDGLPNFSNAS